MSETPEHYDMKIQPIEYIMANGLGFCEGNIVKYVSRYGFKGGIDDLKKARHYIDMLIEQLELKGHFSKEEFEKRVQEEQLSSIERFRASYKNKE